MFVPSRTCRKIFLSVLACHQPGLDGLDQLLSFCTVHSLSSELSINLSNIKKFRITKKSWERLESNPGLLGEKQECYPPCYVATHSYDFFTYYVE